jgi:hypothetical protein
VRVSERSVEGGKVCVLRYVIIRFVGAQGVITTTFVAFVTLLCAPACLVRTVACEFRGLWIVVVFNFILVGLLLVVEDVVDIVVADCWGGGDEGVLGSGVGAIGV